MSDQVAHILRHPLFPRAARVLASNMLVGEHDPALAAQFKDAGRYATAMASVYLHTLGGITLPRLKKACAASGLASPGRARLLLQFLHHVGYVEPAPARGDRAAARYVPTPAFLGAWRGHLHSSLLAAALIRPTIVPLIERFGEPEVFETFLRIQARHLLRLARNVIAAPSFLRIFLHRYAGLQIIAMLLASGEGGSFPPDEPLPISLKLTAARFGVSYMHVRRLLHDAAQEGLLAYDATGTVTLLEDTREMIGLFYATQLAELAGSAAETLAMLTPARPAAFVPLVVAAIP